MAENKTPRYLNAYEIKKLLRIPLSTIYYLTQTGAVKSIRIGRHIRYKREDIEYYMNNGIGRGYLPAVENQKERRLYPRIKCEIKGIIKIDLPRFADRDILGTVQDISAGGLFLTNDEEIKADYPVSISFKLNDEGIIVSGRVVRTDDTGTAIKYRNITEEIKEKIVRYVN